MLDSEVKTALITGSARRIGEAIVKQVHSAGFQVVIHYHNSMEEARALAQYCNRIRQNSAFILKQDLLEPHASTFLIESTLAWTGRLDLLVNNASLFLKTEPGKLDDTIWDRLFATNVKVPFLLSEQAYPALVKTKGAIVNISDIHADTPLKEYSVYCQTKAALNMQTKALAKSYAPKVRVNAIAPGAIAWPEGENALSEEIQEKIIQQTPLKQHGKPEYIAQALLGLVTNPYMTGQIIAVDGGRSIY